MMEKLDLYDILSAVVPGILLTTSLPMLFPQIELLAHHAHFPESFAVLALLGFAFFLGQLVQVTGSLLEPLLFWSWGGRPSDVAMINGLGSYLPLDSAKRIAAKVSGVVGSDATSHSLFLYAMQLSDGASIGRATRFNGLYAYHRSLFAGCIVMLILAIPSALWGSLAQASGLTKVLIFCLLLLLAVSLWYRVKQRAFYYVREVMLAAEHAIDAKATEAVG